MTDPSRAASLPAIHALHLVPLVARWNVTEDELLGPLGLSREALEAPGARLSLPEVERLVAHARELTAEPGLPLFFGMAMRISAHGWLGFAALAAPTVRAAIEIAVRFAPTRTDALSLRLDVSGNEARFVLEERASLGSVRDAVLLALVVGIEQIGRAITGADLPGRAELAFPKPAYVDRFQELGAKKLVFDRPENALVFDAALLDLPLTMGDPQAMRLATDACEDELRRLARERALTRRVREVMWGDDRFLSVDEAAQRLAVSSRTLKRRLADEGTSYSELVEDERRSRADALLADPGLSVEQVADRLGYSDLANFTRAYRRWTGRTPAASRRRP